MLGHLKLMAVSAIALTAAVQSASARDLVIAGWGGNYQDVQREVYFRPFAADKGIGFTEATYLGGLVEAKTMADTGNVTWDLVIVEGADLQVGCDEGLFEEIDWSQVPLKDELIPEAVQPCGAGNVVIGTGLAYNRDTVGEAPTSLADFFDTVKWPGKRGLRAGPRFNLELVLMADGVAPADVYKVLSTPEGLDRAFARLAPLRKDLQFWDAGAQPVEWLAANNVAMTFSYNARITAAKNEGKPLEFLWVNPIYSIDAWAIPTGAPNRELALEFINYANDAARQAAFSTRMPYGTTNVKAPELMTPEAAAEIPAGANIETGLFFSDAFWIDNGDAIAERWNAWVTQ
ncbi:ABC transporter substrate-binding protein [Neomegalonema sp.]|uniref:ABC transporter substrate-binding protein n=1 Tax=Neomegalonema sp. TaxID=2039713 RepID=UPI0026366B33|nr:ABC transporter substrate-binding protein [Neomegalonema sp.]MDD2869730.1 ABC transporter substrate-binding protein [Neomegalonema sp.]